MGQSSAKIPTILQSFQIASMLHHKLNCPRSILILQTNNQCGVEGRYELMCNKDVGAVLAAGMALLTYLLITVHYSVFGSIIRQKDSRTGRETAAIYGQDTCAGCSVDVTQRLVYLETRFLCRVCLEPFFNIKVFR